ncbi:MAG: phage holin family protein [Flavobacteriales bacterium]
MGKKLKLAALRVISTSLALVIGDWLMDSVRFEVMWMAAITAVVIGVLNMFVRPVIIYLTLPATLFSFGLFLFVINGIILYLADELVDGFHLESFWSALGLSIIISITNALMEGNARVIRKTSYHEDVD